MGGLQGISNQAPFEAITENTSIFREMTATESVLTAFRSVCHVPMHIPGEPRKYAPAYEASTGRARSV